MKLEKIIVHAEPARPGMTVRDVIMACVEHQVHALPFCDASGRITGPCSREPDTARNGG